MLAAAEREISSAVITVVAPGASPSGSAISGAEDSPRAAISRLTRA